MSDVGDIAAGALPRGIEFDVLGPVELRIGGRATGLSSRKQRLAVSVLVTARRRIVSVDTLVDALWTDAPPASARHVVHNHISVLRKALAAGGADRLLHTDGAGYSLVVADDAVDAGRFERLAAIGQRLLASGRWIDAGEALQCALDLWRGPPFGELAGAAALDAEGRRLDELRMAAVEDRIDAGIGAGQHDRLVGRLEVLVAEHPYRERLWGQLMRCLYAAGRQADALHAFRRVRRRLGDDLGIEPGPELVRLEAEILVQSPALGLGGGVAVRDAAAGVGNMPRRRPELIGRAAEVVRAAGMVEAGALVTLVGPPGVGKTTLALAAAAVAAERFGDGGWLVELAAATRPHEVVALVVAALGLFSGDKLTSPSAVADVLGEQRRLVVLDNCEHVIGAVIELVGAVFIRCPNVAVMATSREVLGCIGEQLVRVTPLGLPDATRLFIDRLDRAGVHPDDVDRHAVDEICARLDGVPLAVELAAARSSAVGLDEIRERLAASNYDLGQRPTGVERHRSMQALVAWSYDLLSADEQRVFERLAVFADGFDLDAATAVGAFAPVCEAVDAHVFSLIDKSLLSVQHTAPVRYRLLEVVRQYAASRLADRGDADEAGRRLLLHYGSWVGRADAGVRGSDEVRWHRGFTAEWNNLRVITRRAIDAGDVDTACRLVWRTRWWATQRDRLEIGEWAHAVLAMPGADAHPLAALVRSASTEVARRRMLWEAYCTHQADGARREEIAGPAPEPWVAMDRFWLDAVTVDAERPACVDEILARAGDSLFWRTAAAWCDAFMSSIRLSTDLAGNADADWRRVHRCVELADELGNPTWLARAMNLHGCAMRSIDPDASASLLERALATARSVDSGLVEAENVVDLAMSYADAGRPLDSAALVLDGFARYRRAGASLQVRDMFILSFRALVQLGGDEAACIVAAHMARGVTDVWREYFTPRRLVTVVEDRLGPARTTRLQVMARHQRTRDAIDQVERVLTDLHATARS